MRVKKVAKKTVKKATKPAAAVRAAALGGAKDGYGAADITVLEGLDPVRKRPGMYIGTTGLEGLHHLIWEVFDNSRDEAMGGHADHVEVALLSDNRVRVADNGRGIPVDIHKQTKVSALQTIMTTLHAGGKFDHKAYAVSGGLHGVGVSVVNALSVNVKAEVHRDGGVHMQEYVAGQPKAKVKKVGASTATGSVITFEPDPAIFPEIAFDWDKVVSHLRQQAYLVKGLRVDILDARKSGKAFDVDKTFFLRDQGIDVPSMSFYFEGGLLSLVKFTNEHQKPIHKNIFYIEKQADEKVLVEISLQYVDDISARLLAFANNTYTAEGGMHVTGFKTALTRTLNNYSRKNKLIKEGEDNFTGDDVLEGLTVVISVKLPDIQFEGQTKAKLGSVEARGAVETVFSDSFSAFLEEHPDDARAIIGKVVLALSARKAAKAAKDSVLRKGALDGLALPGKLADCQSKSAEESELFIVEGDSAGGCFVGDTKVALADGRELSFKELVREHKQGKTNYCYTIDTDKKVQIARIENPRITKRKSHLVKVVLDSDEEILCTPDHRFMLRDSTYKQAAMLSTSDSLMPLYRQISEVGGRITIEGYEMVWSPSEHQFVFTHLVGDRHNVRCGVYKKERGDTIHHVDFNKRNNNPDNLTRMNKQGHLEIMTTPRMRKLLSRRAKKQWENEEYKEYMKHAFLSFYYTNDRYRIENTARLNENQKAYWSTEENRKAQADRVRKFFEDHPHLRDEWALLAMAQWSDGALRAWRAQKTKEQWTAEFRAARKNTYNKTYREKALRLLHEIYQRNGTVDYNAYDQVRKQTNDKSIIRHDTICDRFFNGDWRALETAVQNYNHHIKRVEAVDMRKDVYDLEVPGTHNFALASGVFVHNSAKSGRDRRTQAILPMWGKVLNVERARLDKVVSARGVKELIIAMGTAIGDTFDVSKLRYHKIIIATDADVDGAHIRTLFLTLFYRYFKEIIEGGYLYIAQPPLYKIKRGKDVFYAYNDEEKMRILGKDAARVSDIDEAGEGEETEAEEAGAISPGASEAGEGSGRAPAGKAKISIQRYKGLGEMNADELWETTMDPARRVLKQVTIEDAREADKIFDILMGSEVAPRKSFIQSNAKLATLDI